MSDIIDIILNKGLGSFSHEKKCNLKVKRPTPHLSLEYKEPKTLRIFQLSWYSKFNWLAGSVEREITLSCSEERMSGV
jgi:hypothetical protein